LTNFLSQRFINSPTINCRKTLNLNYIVTYFLDARYNNKSENLPDQPPPAHLFYHINNVNIATKALPNFVIFLPSISTA